MNALCGLCNQIHESGKCDPEMFRAAEKIYEGLTKQRFYVWYENDLDKHISGYVGAKFRAEILKDIIKLFQLDKKE